MTGTAGRAPRAPRSLRVPLMRRARSGSSSDVGLLLVTGDRGLAGGFNSQVIRAGVRLQVSSRRKDAAWGGTRRGGAGSPRWSSAGTS